MATGFRENAVVGLCLLAMVVVGSIGAEAQLQLSANLTTQFYDTKCPQIYDIVKTEIRAAVANETRVAASLVRLHFHDCFIQGCDGSILLDNITGTSFQTEKDAVGPNKDSVRGFETIDAIKAKLEAACPHTVSCADILAIASRDSAVEAGLSPGYPVFFGRRDSLTPNFNAANTTNLSPGNLGSLPAPFFNYTVLKAIFENVGLDEVDLVALSGAHTIGRFRCSAYVSLLKIFGNDTGVDPDLQKSRVDACNAANASISHDFLLNLDRVTPDFFDNWYYKNLLNAQGVFKSDQTLFNTAGGIGQPLVAKYAFDQAAFEEQFAVSTIKMGNIQPLIGNEGEIRLKCSVPNSASPNATLTSSTRSDRSAPSRVASQ